MLRYSWTLLLLLSACKPSSTLQVSDAQGQTQYQQHTLSTRLDDPASPRGYRETHIEYPVLDTQGPHSPLNHINHHIAQMSQEVWCEQGKGDKHFKASVLFMNERLVSLLFSDTWMCASMPHREDREGAITYNRQTGQPLSLVDEIKKNKYRALIAELNQRLEQHWQDDDCPTEAQWEHFYAIEKGVVFLYSPSDYAASHCKREVKLDSHELEPYLKAHSILRTPS